MQLRRRSEEEFKSSIRSGIFSLMGNASRIKVDILLGAKQK